MSRTEFPTPRPRVRAVDLFFAFCCAFVLEVGFRRIARGEPWNFDNIFGLIWSALICAFAWYSSRTRANQSLVLTETELVIGYGRAFTAVPIARLTRVAHATQPLRTLTFRPSFRLQRFPQLAVASTGADTVLIAPLDQEALMAALRARNPAIAMPEGVRTSRAPETIPLNEGGL